MTLQSAARFDGSPVPTAEAAPADPPNLAGLARPGMPAMPRLPHLPPGGLGEPRPPLPPPHLPTQPTPPPPPPPPAGPVNGPVPPLADAARSVLVKVHNTTSGDLTLQRTGLDHGEWSSFAGRTYAPPTHIPAGTTWCFESESDGFATGTAGRATYAIGSTGLTVQFCWDDPYVGGNTYRAILAQPPDQPLRFSAGYAGGHGDNATVDFTLGEIHATMTAVTNDRQVGGGEWMNSTAAMATTGLISGHTHIWTTNWLNGYHGSVLPVLVDADQRIVWPADVDGQKHRYGVDGLGAIGLPSSVSAYWSNQVPADIVAQARGLALIQWVDPKNMLGRDLEILGKALGVAAQIIKLAAGGGS